MEQLNENLSMKFAMKDVRQRYHFLGIKVREFLRGITLSQNKYIKDLLNQANVLDYSNFNTQVALKP